MHVTAANISRKYNRAETYQFVRRFSNTLSITVHFTKTLEMWYVLRDRL